MSKFKDMQKDCQLLKINEFTTQLKVQMRLSAHVPGKQPAEGNWQLHRRDVYQAELVVEIEGHHLLVLNSKYCIKTWNIYFVDL